MPCTPATVLLVEDETNVLKMLERYLAPAYRVLTATNGRDALELVRTEKEIDVVVTDIRMPQMDGLQLIRALKRLRPELPAIVMTAHPGEETVVEALRAGASNYLRKPFKTQELSSTLRKCVELAEARRGRATSFRSLRESTKVFELPAQLEAARAVVPHLSDGLTELGIVEPQDALNVDVALEEAMANAILHGTLLLTEELDRLRADRPSFERAYEARRNDPRFAGKTILVIARTTPMDAVFTVEDHGPGFAPERLPPREQLTTLEGVAGRGLLLIRLFMDEVVHDLGGRRIKMLKRAPRPG